MLARTSVAIENLHLHRTRFTMPECGLTQTPSSAHRWMLQQICSAVQLGSPPPSQPCKTSVSNLGGSMNSMNEGRALGLVYPFGTLGTHRSASEWAQSR